MNWLNKEMAFASLTGCLIGNPFSVSLKKKGTTMSPSFSVQILTCSLRFPIAATSGKVTIKLANSLKKYNKTLSLQVT